VDPLVLLKYGEKGVTPVNNLPKKLPHILYRGGSPYISWNGKILGVVHSERITYQNKWYYLHYFVILDENLRVAEISAPFFIERRGCEYLAGIAPVPGGLLLSYAIGDRRGRTVLVSEQIVKSMLRVTFS